jgi:hypothetical protein
MQALFFDGPPVPGADDPWAHFDKFLSAELIMLLLLVFVFILIPATLIVYLRRSEKNRFVNKFYRWLLAQPNLQCKRAAFSRRFIWVVYSGDIIGLLPYNPDGISSEQIHTEVVPYMMALQYLGLNMGAIQTPYGNIFDTLLLAKEGNQAILNYTSLHMLWSLTRKKIFIGTSNWPAPAASTSKDAKS